MSENGKQAYQTLLNIQLFAIDGIGYSGKTSDGEKAFDILVEEKQAAAAFKNLINKATIEGAFYGLFGLKMIDCSCYQEEFISFKQTRILKDNNEKLSTASGCSPYEAETTADKEFYLDYLESMDYFGRQAKWKNGLKEQRKLKQQKPN